MYDEISQIKRDEGLMPVLYKCPLGYYTIGYGHNLERNGEDPRVVEAIFRGVEWSVQRSENVLRLDLVLIGEQLIKEHPWILEQPEEVQKVLLNLAYQIGVAGVGKFKKTLKYMKLGAYADAAAEMLDSRWARQTPNRAQRLHDRVRAVA